MLNPQRMASSKVTSTTISAATIQVLAHVWLREWGLAAAVNRGRGAGIRRPEQTPAVNRGGTGPARTGV